MRNILKVIPMAFALFLFSCGGGDSANTSPEMVAFLGMLNGSSDATTAALEMYGATDEIKGHDMGMYNLQDPDILTQTGDCYSVKCKSGMVENTYEICWENAKITSITGG